jgi:hypothetical protein
VIARTLQRRFVLRTDDPQVYSALRFLECAPEIVGEAPRELEIRIEAFRGYYHLLEPGGAVCDQLTPADITDYLHRRLFSLAIEERSEDLVLHAACLRRGGRRVLMVGTEGAGKTTTTLRLMLSGYEIEGDENVFINAESVTARPRGMRVKQGTLAQLPQVAARIAQAPHLVDHDGRKIYNLDPRILGANWQIRSGTVDVILLLRANHGGASSIRPLSPIAAAREIMEEIGFPPVGRGRAVAALARLTGQAQSFDLSLGEPTQAVALIDRVVAGIA